MTYMLRRRRLFSLLQSVSLVMALSHCTGSLAPPPNPVASPQQSIPAAQGQPLFYGFPDVPIPDEMSLQTDDSHLYQAGEIKAGLQTFRGRVDLASLVKFFQLGMLHQGWSVKGEFHHYESLLIFEKPGKACVINICNDLFYTHAKIWVMPSGGKP